MGFKKGQEVICVDDVGTAPNMDLPPELVEGRKYTVAWAGPFTDAFYEGRYDGVRLAEVRRGTDPVSGIEDKPFAARRFRPAVTGNNDSEREKESELDNA